MRPLADLAHAHGALFYADGIQAVGMFPTDVQGRQGSTCCAPGTYKWLLGSFGVAPFYVRRELLDRIRLDRYGALHVERERSDGGFDLYKTAKRFDYATLPFGEVYQLGAGLAYLERVGVGPHRGAHRGAGAASSAPDSWRRATAVHARGQPLVDRDLLHDERRGDPHHGVRAASIDVTVRGAAGQVRVSPALFNTRADIARFLEVSGTLT